MRHGVSVFPTSSNPFPISNATNMLLQLFHSFSYTSSNLLLMMIPFYRFLVRRSYRLYEKGGLSHFEFIGVKFLPGCCIILDKILWSFYWDELLEFFVFLHVSSIRDVRCVEGRIGWSEPDLSFHFLSEVQGPELGSDLYPNFEYICSKLCKLPSRAYTWIILSRANSHLQMPLNNINNGLKIWGGAASVHTPSLHRLEFRSKSQRTKVNPE